MRIVILDGYTINPGDLSWSALEKYGELTVCERTPAELIAPRVGDAEAVMTSKCVLSAQVMCQCPNLKYIGILATGINMVDLEYAADHGITVTNIPAYSTDSVAQFTFSSFAGNLQSDRSSQRNGTFGQVAALRGFLFPADAADGTGRQSLWNRRLRQYRQAGRKNGGSLRHEGLDFQQLPRSGL